MYDLKFFVVNVLLQSYYHSLPDAFISGLNPLGPEFKYVEKYSLIDVICLFATKLTNWIKE